MKEFEETPEYQNYKAILNEKAKTVIRGDDVIHLNYLGPLVDEKSLLELKSDLEEVKIRLSSWDDFGAIKASLEDFSLQVFLLISNPISLEILKTIGLNSVWETIKYSTLKLHTKIFNTPSKESKKIANQINFGFEMKVNDKVSFEFKLDGDLSEDLILNTMDNALDLIREHDGQSIPVLELPVYCIYDKKKGKWKKVDVIEEVKKKGKKKKNK
jgi:hypothetical protein